jgi:hypothetical protein
MCRNFLHLPLKRFRTLLGCLLWLQLAISVVIVCPYLLWHSVIPIWLTPHVSQEQKLNELLGREYRLVKKCRIIPDDSRVFLITAAPFMFSYYLYPRRLYKHGIAKNSPDYDARLSAWLGQQAIDYVIIDHATDLQIVRWKHAPE